MVQFREASALLPYMPTIEGDCTHAIATGRYDLCVLLAVILQHYGEPCPMLRIATLSFNNKNTNDLAAMLASGKVGAITLLCSEFFRDHNSKEFANAVETAATFPGRFRLAAARNHAKVVTMDLPGRPLVLEGSANLRGNGNREQLLIAQDAELHAWHSAWIDNEVDRHEGKRREKADRSNCP